MTWRLLLTTDTVGGVWTYALELARALPSSEVTIALCTMGAPLRDDQRAAVADLPHLYLYESDYRLEWMQDPWDDVYRAGDWLMDVAEEFQPHIVHLNSYVHGAWPWSAPVLMVGHSCVLSWWEAVKGEAAPAAEWGRYTEEVARGLRSADLVLAPTAAMLDALQKHYGPLPRTGVVANGRRADLFPPGGKEPFIFAAGRIWDEAKNIAALDAIAADLDWPVHVAGEEQHPNGGRRSPGALQCLGQLSQREMIDWMGRAAIYCLPARYEPFGLTPLEAALAGCALVLGDIPTLHEVWGDAARFVPTNDPDYLRATLGELIADRGKREELASRGRRRALSYSPSRMAAGYWRAYSQLRKQAQRVPQVEPFPIPVSRSY
jgi:glycogen synthase